MLKYVLLAITGLSGGAMVSAGVFALITSTGVMTRMAGKTHTAKYVRLYETMVIVGGTWWNIFWVFSINFNLPTIVHTILQVIMGVCQGIFVGCLAVSLAEALNATAIFARRAKLKTGVSFIILSAAIGKIIASMIQFINGWVK
ncbi:MAG: stage V sporulation protein AB [Eubacterium sp.]